MPGKAHGNCGLRRRPWTRGDAAARNTCCTTPALKHDNKEQLLQSKQPARDTTSAAGQTRRRAGRRQLRAKALTVGRKGRGSSKQVLHHTCPKARQQNVSSGRSLRNTKAGAHGPLTPGRATQRAGCLQQRQSTVGRKPHAGRGRGMRSGVPRGDPCFAPAPRTPGHG